MDALRIPVATPVMRIECPLHADARTSESGTALRVGFVAALSM